MDALFALSTLSVPSQPHAAVQWVVDLLVGPVGTALAVIAMAWVGFSLLEGRLTVRRGATVVLGCFLLFGAPTIARELLGLALQGNDGTPQVQAQEINAPPPPPSLPARTNPNPFDPYVGLPSTAN